MSEEFWTDDRKARLRLLWDQEMPTRDIGIWLGTTGNAVIGKARRMHLTPRPSPIRRDGTAPRAKPLVAKAPSLPILESLTPALAKAPEPIVAPKAAPVPVVPPTPPVARYGRVVTCCWPLGEVKSKAFRFCDEPSVPGHRTPYCADHLRVATVRPPRPGAQLGAD